MNANPRILFNSALALAMATALPACGDPAGLATTGTMDAALYDGAGAGQAPAQSSSVEPSSSTEPSGASTYGSYHGSANGSAQVYIYNDVRGWVLLGAPANVTMQLQSEDEASIYAAAEVPFGTYTRVRLVLSGFQASLNAGAVLGGVTFNSSVNVAMGGDDLTVTIERTVTPFTISASSHTKVRFDMNTEVWMDEQNANDESASDQEVDDATQADVSEQCGGSTPC